MIAYAIYDMTAAESGNLPEISILPIKSLKIKVGWPLFLVLIILAGFGGISVYFYSHYQHAQELLRDPAAAAQEETRLLVEKIDRHILVPKGETPIIAKVTDTKQLAGNPFFAQAQTGDVMVIFSQAKKAILYRPGTDRIVNILSLNPEPSVAGTSTASAQMQSATLTIYNSTMTAGLASVAERKITAQIDQIKITDKANSKINNYAKSVVVVLNPGAKDLGTKLADMIKAEIGSNLPTGETKPNTDLLLILGTDFKP